ncbi:hypothetical protein [Noviherbaspirillum malthae]|jgi:hypothetical protein|uniref:hypothetical protein n=1 Tax=Noviherbaspirillum malthae TaxID=1260987 RepID=UPI00188EEB7F|nr:hypothetical protein [Noviherbaspirillum malthae]
MSKCQVIPLQGKIRAKYAETKIASLSAMLSDGVADMLPERQRARIYAFHRPETSVARDMTDPIQPDTSGQHGLPRQDS